MYIKYWYLCLNPSIGHKFLRFDHCFAVHSVKIIQLVQDFEHLSSVLADGVVYFVKECDADTLISEILR